MALVNFGRTEVRSLEEIGQRLDELADELGLPELVGLAEDLASYLDPAPAIPDGQIIATNSTTANSGPYLVVTNNGLTMSNGSIKVRP